MNITALFPQMIYLFIIIIAGFAAAKAGFITEKVNESISRLLVCVTCPLQIISSVTKPGNHPISNKQTLILTGLSFVFYFVLIGVAKLLSFVIKGEGKQTDLYRFMFIFSNVSYIGFPVIDALFGVEYRFYATIFVLTFNIFCWTYGVSLISGEKFKFRPKMFLTPMFIAAVLAFALYFSKLGMRCPELLYKAVAGIGDTTPVLAMLLTGSTLAALTLKQVFGCWQIWAMSLAKLIVFPIIFWFIAGLFIKDSVVLGVLTVIVCMPVGTLATVMCYQYGGDEKLASAGIFFTTLASVFTVPLMMTLLFRIWA